MKRFIGILLLVLGSALSVYALPQGWEWRSPQPQGCGLLDVTFVDAQNGWAVGHIGAIIHTSDGGVSWDAQASGTEASLLSVAFAGTSRGWIVSDAGALLRTTNGGINWAVQIVDSSARFEKVRFADSDHGWICSPSGIHRTTDGGASWIEVAVTPPELDGWVDFSFIDAQTGWMVSSAGNIVHTADGGATWSLPIRAVADWTNSVCFVDSICGWIAGINIYRTVDGGQSWTPQNGAALKVLFVDQSNGWALTPSMFPGEETILHTTNAGITWTPQFPGDPAHPLNSFACAGLAAVGPSQACIVGMHGFVIRTTDGGNEWTEAVPHINVGLQGLDFLDSNYGWVAGTYSQSMDFVGLVSKTEDGGNSWTVSDSLRNHSFHTVRFSDPNHGWVLGYNPAPPFQPDVRHTSDGGNDWSPQTLPVTTGVFPTDIAMADSLNGWITGYYYWNPTQATALVFHTVDGGIHWTVQDSSFSSSFMRVCAIDANHAWIAADYTLRHTTDGGLTWMQAASPINGWIGNLFFTDVDHGWASVIEDSTGTGWLLRTTNGGNSWTSQAMPGLRISGPMHFVDNAEGWVFAGTTLLHTLDGGATWTPARFNVGATISAMDFTAPNSGWITADNGSVLHYAGTQTNPDIVVQPSASIPRDLSLSVYPNPFNPVTQIKLNLTDRMLGHLAVYDITGRLVRELSSGFFEAGDHEYRWDGRDRGGNPVTSGIYFCRFSSNKISATQRLLLLK